jgi:putative NADH-flavin reductase
VRKPTILRSVFSYTKRMQITVFGAAGKVGSRVVAEALEHGHTVVASVHSHDPFGLSDRLIIRKGDIYNAADVAEAIKGSDAVISCLSSWGTKGRDVLSSFVRNVTPAMERQQITRLVTLTGIGVQKRPGKAHRTLLAAMGWLPVGKVFADAERHVHLLDSSSLDWTAVCSPVMNNLGGAGYSLSLRTGNPLATINRKSVAAALLDQIESDEYVRQTPVIHRQGQAS